jgi:hypothetical protein
MELTATQQGAIRRYLLGQLPPEQSKPLEEGLFADGAFYDELCIAEDELIDRYLSGDLPADEREGFETHFLAAPERQKKLRFARALRRYVAAEAARLQADPAPANALRTDDAAANTGEQSPDAEAPRGRGKWNLFKLLFARRPALAFSLAAVLLLAVAVSWVAVRPRPRHVPRNVHAVALTHGLLRDTGEDTKRVRIPRDADTLRLQLPLPADEHDKYRAALLADGRVEVWAADDLRPDAGVLVLDVPSDELKPGDYQVKVAGRPAGGGDFEDVGRYTFRILD